MATSLPTLIGYLGSALVVASLTMRSIMRLRIIGLAGGLTFVAYGYLIDAWHIGGVILDDEPRRYHRHARRRCRRRLLRTNTREQVAAHQSPKAAAIRAPESAFPAS